MCDECTSFNNLNDTEKRMAKTDFDFHIAMKTKAREIKEMDKNAALESYGKIVAAVFDFQKVLTTPNGDVSTFYYSRKLSVYNFTVFDLACKTANCYVWDETVAQKGAEEVASALMLFIQENVSRRCTEFRFFSDNCSSQNRNRFVFGLYSLSSKKFNISITHTFLEKGHTQNEGDSVHAVIEKYKKGKTVYVPSEWYTLIWNSKQTGTAYKVIELIQDDFKSFKNFVSKTNWEKDDKGRKIYWSKVQQVRVCSDAPDVIHFKNDLFANEWQSVSLLPNKKINPYRQPLKNKYVKKRSIEKKKHTDLMKLCNQNLIPKAYHAFYKSLDIQSRENETCSSDSDLQN